MTLYVCYGFEAHTSQTMSVNSGFVAQHTNNIAPPHNWELSFASSNEAIHARILPQKFFHFTRNPHRISVCVLHKRPPNGKGFLRISGSKWTLALIPLSDSRSTAC